MALTDRPEWQTWKARGSDHAVRMSARQTLLASLDRPAIDELIGLCARAEASEAMAAASLLMAVLEETESKVEWQGRLAEAFTLLIPRLAYGSRDWSVAHAMYSLISGQSFLPNDLATRGIPMEQYQARRDALRRTSAEALVPRRGAQEALQAFLASGGSLNGYPSADVLGWIEDWRSSRSARALSLLYERLINPLGERAVSLRDIIGVLGPPDDVTPSFAYYGLNADSGLVLHADSDGYLSGRKLN